MVISPPSHHPATAWVDLDRVCSNFAALQACAGRRLVIPVLKANAYGHGALAMARALAPIGASMFAVAYVDEAIALRQAGLSTPLLILTGFVPQQLSAMIEFRLTPVISTIEQVNALESLGFDDPRHRIAVHVKVDTGMARLGFSLSEFEPIIRRLASLHSVEIEGLMTHLACADEDPIPTARQLDAFDEAVHRTHTLGIRPRLIHAANSAGMMSLRETHTAVRPGLLLYGIKPRPLAPEIEVKPAMEFQVRVGLIKSVPAGTKVSYGGRLVTARECRIATINAGYADGIPRTDAMRQWGTVRHRGIALKVAGTVCMDLTMIDATDSPLLEAGDWVTIFGDAPGAWDVAGWAGTNAWQILTGVGPRVLRRYYLGGRIVNEELIVQGY